MKFLLFVFATVAAVLAVSQKENLQSDLLKLGVRKNEFCTIMMASEGPSFNPEYVRTVKDLSAFKKLHGAYGLTTFDQTTIFPGMNYNGGVMELTAEARNAEIQNGPGFRSHRPEGIYTEKSMASIFVQNQLYDLTPAQWDSILGDRSNQTCDSTTYNPISQVHQIMKFPEISCNTICRTCFPYTLPICLKNDEVKTCLCTFDARKPVENFVFRITDFSA